MQRNLNSHALLVGMSVVVAGTLGQSLKAPQKVKYKGTSMSKTSWKNGVKREVDSGGKYFFILCIFHEPSEIILSNIDLSSDPEILLPSTQPREMKICSQENLHMNIQSY